MCVLKNPKKRNSFCVWLQPQNPPLWTTLENFIAKQKNYTSFSPACTENEIAKTQHYLNQISALTFCKASELVLDAWSFPGAWVLGAWSFFSGLLFRSGATTFAFSGSKSNALRP